MAKSTAKADISSKEFTKLLAPLEEKPHKVIIQRIDSKMFSLDQNLVYNFKPEYLAFQEFSRALELFKRRNPKDKIEKAFTRYSGVQALIVKEELPHRKALHQLAIDTIRELYNVPEYIDLNAFINPNLSLDTQQDKSPAPFLELSLEQKNAMRDEIQKRVILNGLVHGSSMHAWRGMHHLVADKLDAINGNLRHLYDHYTSCMGVIMWYINPNDFQEAIDNNIQLTQGFNTIKFNREEENSFGGKIEAKGINFATLLHELNKGVLDWMISWSIPKTYNEAEMKYYMANADAYNNEVWHYLLSSTLWVDLLTVAQVENEDLVKLVKKLTTMTYKELSALFRLIITDKAKAAEEIKLWNL